MRMFWLVPMTSKKCFWVTRVGFRVWGYGRSVASWVMYYIY